MKYSILLIVFLFFAATSQAQIAKGKKLLEKGDWEGAILAFENDLEKATSKPVSLYELSKIYFDRKFIKFDLEKAYLYASRAIAEYENLSSANRKKLQSKGHSKIGMSKYQNDVVIAAITEAEKANTLAAAQRFLDYYTSASKQQEENMIKRRDRLAFEEAKRLDNFKAYESFFKQHELTCERFNRSLLIQAQKKLLESYIEEKGWSLYPAFEEKYLENIYVKDQKAAYALIKIVRKNSLKEYINFTNAYPHSPFNKFAQDYMYRIIMEGTSLPDYDRFLRAYPNYEESEKIWLKFYRLYLQEHGPNSVADFAKSYPNYPFQDAIKSDAQDAQNKKDQPRFEKAKKTEDIRLMMDFIKDSPSSPFIVQLEDAMFAALKKEPLFRASKKFLKLYPNSKHYDAVLDLLYDEYVKDGELVSLNQFMMEYPEYKDMNKQKKDLEIAEHGAKLDLTKHFHVNELPIYEAYIKAAAPKERAFVALQRIIEKDIHDHNWDAALAQVNKMAPAFGDKDPKIADLKKILAAKQSKLKKTPLGPSINTSAHEYIPLVSVNNKFLYFCRVDKNNDENIYVSEFKDGKWGEAAYLSGLNTHDGSEGALAISPDNRHIIIYKGAIRKGDMQIAEHTNNGWTKPVSLPNTINTDAWDADAMISSDGKALLYVSERPEVLDLQLDDHPSGFHGRSSSVGNRDIFVALKNAAGDWQEPINLGDVINTPFVERTPFLHPDMRTLYFSSDGHGGLGHLDVYKTTRLDDTWQNWSKPVNLGTAINTASNDWGYRVSTDGKTAYFAATNENKDEDIYSIEFPEEHRPQTVSTISGHLTDYKGNPIEAEVIWEDMETGNEVGRLKSNHTTGEFFIALPNDRQYSYFVFKEHYFPKSNHLDLRKNKGMIEVEEKLQLIKIDEMVEHGISLPLKNLFFETGKFSIQNASHLELKRVAELVKKYDLTIEVSGHTDNQGNSKDNLTLSQNRADAVKDYLIKLGCKNSKITAKGFGSSKAVADNKTEANRKLNRRVEVRFSK